MVLLIEVFYNRYNTIFYYNTDTLHLQGALILTVLYTGTTYIYNTSTDTLQDALIHTALYAGKLTFTIQIQYIYRAP